MIKSAPRHFSFTDVPPDAPQEDRQNRQEDDCTPFPGSAHSGPLQVAFLFLSFAVRHKGSTNHQHDCNTVNLLSFVQVTLEWKGVTWKVQVLVLPLRRGTLVTIDEVARFRRPFSTKIEAFTKTVTGVGGRRPRRTSSRTK